MVDSYSIDIIGLTLTGFTLFYIFQDSDLIIAGKFYFIWGAVLDGESNLSLLIGLDPVLRPAR